MKVSIPKPCSQKLDDMPQTGNGYFCNHCNKEVTDYTNYTKEALIAALSKLKHPCGILRPDQIDRMGKQSSLYRKFTRSVFVAYILSLFNTANAASTKEVKKVEYSYSEIQSIPENFDQITSDSTKMNFTFYWNSEDKREKGLRIILSDHRDRTVIFNKLTDSSGVIRSAIPNKYLNDSLDLELVYGIDTSLAAFSYEVNKTDYLIDVAETFKVMERSFGVIDNEIIGVAGGISMYRPNIFKRVYYRVRNTFR